MTNKNPVTTETYKQRGSRSYSVCSSVIINSGSFVFSLHSLSGCPNNEANQAKIFPKHSKSPVSKKTPHLSPTSTSPLSVSGGVKGSVSGSIISTRSSARLVIILHFSSTLTLSVSHFIVNLFLNILFFCRKVFVKEEKHHGGQHKCESSFVHHLLSVCTKIFYVRSSRVERAMH